MTTNLQQRFEKEFTPELLTELSHRYKYYDASRKFLAFIVQEFELVAQEVESTGLGVSKGEDNQGEYYGGLEDAAAIIRTRANELK